MCKEIQSKKAVVHIYILHTHTHKQIRILKKNQIDSKVGCLDEWIQAPVSKKNEQLILVVKFTASAVGIIYTFINPSAD